MVLSRFWLVIFISSILFIIVGLFTSQYYSIDYVLNGKKDEPILIAEKFINEFPKPLQDSILKAENCDIFDILLHISYESDLITRTQRAVHTKEDQAFFSIYENLKAQDFLRLALVS